MLAFALGALLLGLLAPAEAAVTVYGVIPLGQATLTAGAAPQPTPTLPAYDGTVLRPPQPPFPPVERLNLNVQRDALQVAGLSIPHTGPSFFGFSVEMSVITQTIGKNSTHIFPPFLNLMANIDERAGSVMIRLGGNTQEYAKFYDGIFDDGRITQKEELLSQQTTETPAVMYTIDMFYMLANISSLVNAKWFLGLPFNDISTWHLEMAEHGQQIIGDNLLGLQAGNEPDLYGRHFKRPSTYSAYDYVGEIHDMLEQVDGNPRIPVKNKFIAPSVSSSGWRPEIVWETGFIDTFKDRLFALSVERYPDNNCFMQFGTGSWVDPQEIFPRFLRHDTQVELMSEYTTSTTLAQQAGLPFIMFETNTGSCGGFPGLSQSYGAALWGLDYALSMAHNNFSNALLHIGGQNVYYNPWISPPTNQSAFNQWTVGSIFYSALVMAEVFGKSNTGRIIDLGIESPFTPAYAIYENDAISRFALFNFVDDPSGANNIEVGLTIDGGVPASVRVKYLSAESVSSKTNIRWAGQTFGNNFEADGRLKGDLNVIVVQCDQGANVCNIPIRAPSFALVFLDSNAETSVGQATATFATTAYTKRHNTATHDPTELARSNGHNGTQRERLRSTSQGSTENGGSRRYELMSNLFFVLVSLGAGGWIIGRAMVH